MKTPENLPDVPDADEIIWSVRYEARCQLYPARDCPGCEVFCARTDARLEPSTEGE